jgi:hypothetical protein
MLIVFDLILKGKVIEKILSMTFLIAEEGGFEPPDPLLAGQLFSRQPRSTAPAPLQ